MEGPELGLCWCLMLPSLFQDESKNSLVWPTLFVPLLREIEDCLFVAAAALHEPQICYILDGILFLYGIILTALYCRVKIMNYKKSKAGKGKQAADEGIYTGLTQPADTYETIRMKT